MKRNILLWSSCIGTSFNDIQSHIMSASTTLINNKKIISFDTSNLYYRCDRELNSYRLTFEQLVEKMRDIVKDIDFIISTDNFINIDDADEMSYVQNYHKFKNSNLTLAEFAQDANYFRVVALYNFVLRMIAIDVLNKKMSIFLLDAKQCKYKPYVKNADNVRLFYTHKIDKFIFNNAQLEVEYLPFDQFAYIPSQLSVMTTKKYDFVFGCSRGWHKNIVEYRDPIIASITKYVNDNTNTYFTFSQSNQVERIENNSKDALVYDDYINALHYSYTTLVIASYDKRFCSIRRFFEALQVGCICLVDKNSSYKAGFDYDEEMIKFVEQYLLVDATDANEISSAVNYIKSNYFNILQKLFSINYIKRLSSLEYYENIFNDKFE